MTGRVLALVAAEAVLVAAGVAVLPSPGGEAWSSSPSLVVGYTLAMVVMVSLSRAFFEHHRHGCWITPSAAAILVGLFFLTPLTFVVACVVAEVAILLRERQAPLKAAFNLVHGVGGFTAAAVVFALLRRTDPLDPSAWLAGVAALAACSAWDVLSTAAVLSIAEREPFLRSLKENAPPLVASLTLSAAIGLPG